MTNFIKKIVGGGTKKAESSCCGVEFKEVGTSVEDSAEGSNCSTASNEESCCGTEAADDSCCSTVETSSCCG